MAAFQVAALRAFQVNLGDLLAATARFGAGHVCIGLISLKDSLLIEV